jgi:phosphotransferase system enzyme I (PtsI)
MDIPAVVGLKNLSIRLKTGDLVIVDGNSGDVVLRPTGDQFQKYNRRRQKFLYFDETVHAQKDLKAATKDGIEVRVMANIESSGDLPHLAEHGAEGVGLYRTEFLYLNRNEWPDEEEQFQDYKKVAQVVAPHYAVIRTLDIGGDKISPSKSFSEVEPNPAMGLRAIRYCLKHPKIFKTQLKAILRASHYGKLKIMYPLITTVEELLAANALLEECKKQLAENEIPFDSDIEVGIMIETPSSVMLADILARHCSFFSIGTNDLIQYTMAIDRINEQVAYLYEPLSPAIVRMLSVAINAATKAGIGISVCGKMAGDPAYALLLLGMGQTINLSMDVHSIPRIKKFIRSISIAEAKQVGVEALAANDTEELKGLIAARLTLAAAEGITSALVGNVD